MSKNIAVLGSTGSIGTNALRVIEALGQEYSLTAITGHKNTDLLAEQANRFKPKYVAVTNGGKTSDYKDKFPNDSIIMTGPQAMEEIAASDDVDLVLAAVVGAAGLRAILAAARAGKTIAIANKEPLVIAGQLLMQTARENGATILPVDSEHCAIFQCMAGGRSQEVAKLILTGSGGPFRTSTPEQMANATLKQALDHPTWDMGQKITIDSATMINKSLEIIEARWLFDVDVDKIDVLIHPESIVHSMVEFVDGSVMAQLGSPDMCHPIQYAITWPERKTGITKHLRLDELGTLTFEKPRPHLRPALDMAINSARLGGSMPVVFNAANEAAVGLFLEEKIKFGNILELVGNCMSTHSVQNDLKLDQLLEIDNWARNSVKIAADRLKCR